MTVYTIENINENSLKITISRDDIPYRVLSFLFLFAVLGFASPIIATVMLEEGQKQLLLLTYIIMWGVGIYLLRLILWNIKGKQVIELSPTEIHHYFDYHLFKDRKFGMKKNSLQISIESEDGKFGKLFIHDNDKITISPYELTCEELLEIEQEIENFMMH